MSDVLIPIPYFKNKARIRLEAEKEALIKEIRNLGKMGAADGVKESLVKKRLRLAEIDNIIKSGNYSPEVESGYNLDPYTPSTPGFSLGNLLGRTWIGRNREDLPVDVYGDKLIAETFTGGESTPADLLDHLRKVKTSDDNSIVFDSSIFFHNGMKEDDPDTIRKAVKHCHDVAMINAENKAALAAMIEAKEELIPFNIGGGFIKTAINVFLCDRAKKYAWIFTNKSGFASLDNDADGESGPESITRDANGNFIYRGKYRIQEIPDEIFPNINGYPPIIVGDPAVLRFFVTREAFLEKDNFEEYTTIDRELKREFIVLTSTSNEAYIAGYLTYGAYIGDYSEFLDSDSGEDDGNTTGDPDPGDGNQGDGSSDPDPDPGVDPSDPETGDDNP